MNLNIWPEIPTAPAVRVAESVIVEFRVAEVGPLYARDVATLLNVAVTDFAADIETVQVPVPVHAPLQPAKVPVDAEAVNVTEVPEANDAAQVDGQLIPMGDDVTVPVPDPVTVTPKLYVVVPPHDCGVNLMMRVCQLLE